MLTDWAAVIADDFALPERRPLRDLRDELSVMLASPVPEERDNTGYTILAIWTARGVLDDHLAVLGDRMAKRLGDDQIHVRTFAAMVLAWVVLREAHTAELDVDTVSALAGRLRWLVAPRARSARLGCPARLVACGGTWRGRAAGVRTLTASRRGGSVRPSRSGR